MVDGSLRQLGHPRLEPRKQAGGHQDFCLGHLRRRRVFTHEYGHPSGQSVRVPGHQPDRVEGRAELHAALDADPSVGWPQPEQTIVEAGNADRPARVRAQAQISQPPGDGGGRPARRPAGNPVWRDRVAGGAVVQIGPNQRTGELVRDGLADHAGAGVDERLHGWCRPRSGLVAARPVERSAGRGQALHVEQILDREPQPGQRTLPCTVNSMVQDEGIIDDAVLISGGRRRRRGHVSLNGFNGSVGR